MSAANDGGGPGAVPPGAELRRFLVYLGIGALATAAHYAVLIVAVEWARTPAWLASGVGAVIGAQVAYAGNRLVTFAYDGPLGPSWRRFQLTALAGAAVGMAVVALAVNAGLHYVAAQVLATGLVSVLTYAVNRAWAFSPTPDRG